MLWPLALATCLPGCDVVGSHYDTLAEARADGHIERGWLPDVLPGSAIDIEAENDLDLNVSFGEFSYRVGDDAEMLVLLQPGAPKQSPFADWPGTVAGRRSAGWLPWTYRDDDATWVFFCSRSKGRCETWMWQEPGPVALPALGNQSVDSP